MKCSASLQPLQGLLGWSNLGRNVWDLCYLPYCVMEWSGVLYQSGRLLFSLLYSHLIGIVSARSDSSCRPVGFQVHGCIGVSDSIEGSCRRLCTAVVEIGLRRRQNLDIAIIQHPNAHIHELR